MIQDKVLLLIHHLYTRVHWNFSTVLFDHICVNFFQDIYFKKCFMAETFGRGFKNVTLLKWKKEEVGTVLGPHYSLENLVFICEITQFHDFIKLSN